jgi:hypothetical protein
MAALISRAIAASNEEPHFLRRILLFDAALSGVSGLALVLGAGPLGERFDLPVALLVGAGLVTLPWAAALIYLATRPTLPRTAVLAVIGLNLLWVVDSIALVLTGWVEPNALGYTFVVVQALAVALIAEFQCVALRRSAMTGRGAAPVGVA